MVGRTVRLNIEIAVGRNRGSWRIRKLNWWDWRRFLRS